MVGRGVRGQSGGRGGRGIPQGMRGRGRAQSSVAIEKKDGIIEPSTLEDQVDDMYDPAEPNNYIQIQKERDAQKAQQRREKERQEHLERLEEEREKLALQRQELARSQVNSTREDVSSLAVNPLQQHRPLGRGRGISNLPAWLTAGQAPAPAPLPTIPQQETTPKKADKQKSGNKPSRILLLRNLAPGPQLLAETRSECEVKYGALEDCAIDLQATEADAVAIALKFVDKNHALKAFIDLKGRFFAGRQINAEFLEEFPSSAV